MHHHVKDASWAPTLFVREVPPVCFQFVIEITGLCHNLSELEQLSAHDEAAVLSFLHATGRSRARVFVMLQFCMVYHELQKHVQIRHTSSGTKSGPRMKERRLISLIKPWATLQRFPYHAHGRSDHLMRFPFLFVGQNSNQNVFWLLGLHLPLNDESNFS